MNSLVKRFAADESGATAIEYGLIAAGISVAIIAAVKGLGTQIGNTMNYVATTLASSQAAGK
jgi:pilus assembly protein Flp/PilA